jgi:hypothetical protein
LHVENVAPSLDATNAPPMKCPYDGAIAAGADSRELAYCSAGTISVLADRIG